MGTTKEGAAKAKATLIAKFGGEDKYHEWRVASGRNGGAKSRGGGWSGDPERARYFGAIGGSKSRKRKEAE